MQTKLHLEVRKKNKNQYRELKLSTLNFIGKNCKCVLHGITDDVLSKDGIVKKGKVALSLSGPHGWSLIFDKED